MRKKKKWKQAKSWSLHWSWSCWSLQQGLMDMVYTILQIIFCRDLRWMVLTALIKLRMKQKSFLQRKCRHMSLPLRQETTEKRALPQKKPAWSTSRMAEPKSWSGNRTGTNGSLLLIRRKNIHWQRILLMKIRTSWQRLWRTWNACRRTIWKSLKTHALRIMAKPTRSSRKKKERPWIQKRFRRWSVQLFPQETKKSVWKRKTATKNHRYIKTMKLWKKTVIRWTSLPAAWSPMIFRTGLNSLIEIPSKTGWSGTQTEII